MYNTLRAEIARKNLTMGEIADNLRIARTTLYQKMTRENSFLVNEAVQIKRMLGVNMPIEVLFKE